MDSDTQRCIEDAERSKDALLATVEGNIRLDQIDLKARARFAEALRMAWADLVACLGVLERRK